MAQYNVYNSTHLSIFCFSYVNWIYVQAPFFARVLSIMNISVRVTGVTQTRFHNAKTGRGAHGAKENVYRTANPSKIRVRCNAGAPKRITISIQLHTLCILFVGLWLLLLLGFALSVLGSMRTKSKGKKRKKRGSEGIQISVTVQWHHRERALFTRWCVRGFRQLCHT